MSERRNHGAGSLTHLGADRWRSRIRLPGGTRSDKTLHAPTRREAEVLHRRRLVSADAGELEAKPHTFAELVDEWWPECEARLKPYTIRNYRGALDRHILPALGPLRLDKISGHHLARIYRPPMKPHGARLCHAVISNALKQAVAWGWVRTNVAKGNGPAKPPKREMAPPAPDDVAALIGAALGPEMNCYLHLIATTGMRRGEACALRWRDLNLERGEVKIEHSVTKIKGSAVTVGSTKTSNSRTIAIDAGTVARLRQHKADMQARAKACGALVTSGSFLFSGRAASDQPWDPRVVTMRFTRIRDRLGLKGVRLHDLRHYAATQLIAAGVNPRTVADRLGHVDPSITLGLYAHALRANDRAAADHLGSLLGATSTG